MKPHAGAPCSRRTPADPEDCRCVCGSLVARIADEGVELRCRRCKRTLLIPWSARDAWARPLGATPPKPRRPRAGPPPLSQAP